MNVQINNGSFRLTNGSFSNLIPPPPIGQIFRLYNTNPGFTNIDETLTYTNFYGDAAISTVTAGGSLYVMVKSGSLTDNPAGGDAGKLIITNFLITSSVDEPSLFFVEELLTTAGAGSWVKPDGVTQVIVECWGGGGAGGGATGNPAAGAGGGGGQYSRKFIEYGSAQQSISYVVGAGATGITGNGATGTDTTWQTNVVVAKGGTGGQANSTGASVPGGVGNQAGSVGTVIYFGGGGYIGYIGGASTPLAGAGGGGAGSATSGSTDTGTFEGGSGGGELGGIGGIGIQGISGPGNEGLIYSAGGGGGCANSATDQLGGNGTQGVIRVSYR